MPAAGCSWTTRPLSCTAASEWWCGPANATHTSIITITTQSSSCARNSHKDKNFASLLLDKANSLLLRKIQMALNLVYLVRGATLTIMETLIMSTDIFPSCVRFFNLRYTSSIGGQQFSQTLRRHIFLHTPFTLQECRMCEWVMLMSELQQQQQQKGAKLKIQLVWSGWVQAANNESVSATPRIG